MSDLYDMIRFHGTADEVNAQWHEQRNQGIGGSDVATILGINNFSTPYQLWLEKTGRQQPEDISGKPAIIVGNALEDVVRKWFRDQHPEFIVTAPRGMMRSKQRPWAQASLDGMCRVRGSKLNDISSYAVLECKTVGENRSSDWKDENGNLKVPDYYLTQVTHYLSVTGWPKAYVAVLFGNREFAEIEVARDEADIEAAEGAVDDFWLNYVQKDQMPTLTGPDVAEKWPNPNGGIINADSDESADGFDNLVAAYRQATDEISALSTVKNEIGGKLKVMIGEHSGIKSEGWKATYKTTHYQERITPAHDVRVLRVSAVKNKENK
jgi:putative phage-type endonuclease